MNEPLVIDGVEYERPEAWALCPSALHPHTPDMYGRFPDTYDPNGTRVEWRFMGAISSVVVAALVAAQVPYSKGDN
jgi:hypothetical protein